MTDSIQDRLRSGHTNGTTWEAQSQESANVIDGLVEALEKVTAGIDPDDYPGGAITEISAADLRRARDAIAATKCEDKS